MTEMLRRNRKYTAFWGVFLMASAALFFDKLTGAEFANLVWPVFGLYMGGNVGARWTDRRDS
jgi:hypothetical protein